MANLISLAKMVSHPSISDMDEQELQAHLRRVRQERIAAPIAKPRSSKLPSMKSAQAPTSKKPLNPTFELLSHSELDTLRRYCENQLKKGPCP